MGEKVFPVFSTALWAVAREGEHEREIFHYRMTMLFFYVRFSLRPSYPVAIVSVERKIGKKSLRKLEGNQGLFESEIGSYIAKDKVDY